MKKDTNDIEIEKTSKIFREIKKNFDKKLNFMTGLYENEKDKTAIKYQSLMRTFDRVKDNTEIKEMIPEALKALETTMNEFYNSAINEHSKLEESEKHKIKEMKKLYFDPFIQNIKLYNNNTLDGMKKKVEEIKIEYQELKFITDLYPALYNSRKKVIHSSINKQEKQGKLGKRYYSLRATLIKINKSLQQQEINTIPIALQTLSNSIGEFLKTLNENHSSLSELQKTNIRSFCDNAIQNIITYEVNRANLKNAENVIKNYENKRYNPSNSSLDIKHNFDESLLKKLGKPYQEILNKRNQEKGIKKTLISTFIKKLSDTPFYKEFKNMNLRDLLKKNEIYSYCSALVYLIIHPRNLKDRFLGTSTRLIENLQLSITNYDENNKIFIPKNILDKFPSEINIHFSGDSDLEIMCLLLKYFDFKEGLHFSEFSGRNNTHYKTATLLIQGKKIKLKLSYELYQNNYFQQTNYGERKSDINVVLFNFHKKDTFNNVPKSIGMINSPKNNNNEDKKIVILGGFNKNNVFETSKEDLSELAKFFKLDSYCVNYQDRENIKEVIHKVVAKHIVEEYVPDDLKKKYKLNTNTIEKAIIPITEKMQATIQIRENTTILNQLRRNDATFSKMPPELISEIVKFTINKGLFSKTSEIQNICLKALDKDEKRHNNKKI